MRRIDWPKVSERYDGVVIAPYVWSLRMGDYEMIEGRMRKTPDSAISDWYYPWDCASGCIWKASAIKAFDLIKENANAD
jgi:hypothetical protein